MESAPTTNHRRNLNNGEPDYSNQHFCLQQAKLLDNILKMSSQKHWNANKLPWNLETNS